MRSAITTGNAHVDICANGFWTGAQDAYFDVRVQHTKQRWFTLFKKHEDVAYGQHIRQIEHSVFTPL